MSILQGEDDIFLDMRQKFWNTYKVRQTSEKYNHDLSVSFFCCFFFNIYLFGCVRSYFPQGIFHCGLQA